MRHSYESYPKWQNQSKFKVGDEVRIIRKPTLEDGGGFAGWAEHMDVSIGHIGRIEESNNNGFDVHTEVAGTWVYPYFVLEKVVRGPKLTDNFRKNGFQ